MRGGQHTRRKPHGTEGGRGELHAIGGEGIVSGTMASLTFTEQDRERLHELGVAAVYLFGSHATGTASPRSDYDFGILMRPGSPIPERLDRTYQMLYDLFAPHCPRTLAHDAIDIVFLERAPLELRFHVLRYGAVLFDADPRARAHFEEQTMEEYCDYFPLLQQFDQTILAAT